MVSGPAVILLGQTILVGLSPNGTIGDTKGLYIPGISKPLPRNVTRREDYTYTPGIGGHKFHTAAATWIHAANTCWEEGGHLVVINSVTEADSIVQVIADADPVEDAYSSNDFWIGNHDLVSQEGNWETIFGESLPDAGYNEWHEDKSRGGAHCGGVFTDGRLTWRSCIRKLGFICEVAEYPSCTSGESLTAQKPSWWIRESLRKLLLQ